MTEKTVAPSSHTNRLLLEANAFEESQSPPAPALLRIGDVFDEAFDVYKRHARSLILVFALIWVPTQILLHALFSVWTLPLYRILEAATEEEGLEASLRVLGAFAITGAPQYNIPGLVACGALVLAGVPLTRMSTALFLDKSLSYKQAFQGAWSRALRSAIGWGVAGLATFATLSAGYVVVLTLVGAIALSVAGNGAGELEGFLAALLLFTPFLGMTALIARAFLFTTPLIVLENAPTKSLAERNLQLTKGKAFRRLWAATTLLPMLLFGMPLLVYFSAEMAIESLRPPALLSFWITALTQILTSLFFIPYGFVFMTRLYLNVRFQREGLDIRLLSQAAQLNAPAIPYLPSAALSQRPTFAPAPQKRPRERRVPPPQEPRP